MRRLLIPVLLLAGAASAGIVADVREAVARDDFPAASQRIDTYRKQNGVTPEWLEALSWLGRGALQAKQLDRADAYAAETQRLALDQLKTRPLDAEPHLPLALGAAMEVHAGVLAERGERAEAVSFLQAEMGSFGGASIRTRLQKMLNLLTLEGRPAPPLDIGEWLGPRPQPLESLKGHPVLLFFWAHWCPDCKAEIPALVKLQAAYGSRGLLLIGPTQCYGYVARGQEAPPAAELKYIDEVRRKVYGALQDMPVPTREENFKRYGASNVPTLVLIDRQGIVRMYHPDNMTYEELAAKLEPVLAR